MRPAFLFLDTDVAIQLFIADAAQGVLTPLRKIYRVQPVVVPEVELEVVSNSRHRNRFQQQFRKARGNGLIEVIESSNYGNFVGATAELQKHLVGVSHAQIQTLGRAYNLRADRGEAYTHATAFTMGQPAASNDYSAVKALSSAGHDLPAPVLRMFDLVVFANQVGGLGDDECDEIRQALQKTGREYVPASWSHASYTDGLKTFVSRLIDPSLAPKGLGRASAYAPPFACVLQLQKP